MSSNGGSLVLATTILILSGCTVTPEELRSNPNGTIEVNSGESLETVYVAVKRKAQECFERATVDVEGEYLSSSKYAEVMVSLSDALNNWHMAIIELKGAEGRVKGQAKHTFGLGPKKYAASMAAWANSMDTQELWKCTY